MASVEQRVIELLRALQARHKRTTDGISSSTMLYREGLGLDSLGAAELSTMLEMAFERDPYSEGQIPQTVGDIIRFYDNAVTPK